MLYIQHHIKTIHSG